MNKTAQITILSLAVAFAFVVGGLFGYYSAPPGGSGPSYVKIGNESFPVYPGDEVDVTWDENENLGPTINHYEGSGNAKGAQFDNVGGGGGLSGWTENFQYNAGEIRLSSGSEILGGTVSRNAKMMASSGHMVIIFVGIICVIAGVVCMVYWDKKLGIYIAIAGGALITIGYLFGAYPWIAILIPIAGIGAVIYFWYRTKKGSDKDLTLKTIVKGIETAPAAIAETIKENISTTAKNEGNGPDGVKTVVRNVVNEVKKVIA